MAVASGNRKAETGNESEAFRIAGVALSAATGFCLGAFLKNRSSRKPGPVRKNEPRETAISAVTGGPPEEMNAMPPTFDLEREGPVYDGSQSPH